MPRPRTFKVTVMHRGRIHEMLAEATTCGAALTVALKDNRTLRQAVKRGEASYEVATVRAVKT